MATAPMLPAIDRLRLTPIYTQVSQTIITHNLQNHLFGQSFNRIMQMVEDNILTVAIAERALENLWEDMQKPSICVLTYEIDPSAITPN